MDVDDGARGGKLRALSVHFLTTTLLQDLSSFHGTVDGELVASQPVPDDAKVYELEPRIRGFGADAICPRDGNRGAAYVDVAEDPYAGRATHMLSYAWGYALQDIVDSLRVFCEQNGLDVRQTRVWICCLCVNQTRVKQMQQRGDKVSFEEFENTFYETVTKIGTVLSLAIPWNQPLSFTRIWCAFEVFTAIRRSVRLTVVLPPAEQQRLHDFLSESSRTSVLGGMTKVFELLSKLRVQDAKARYDEDRNRILRVFAGGSTAAQGDALDVACEDVNHIVIDHYKSWLVNSMKQTVLESDSTARQCCALCFSLLSLDKVQDALDVLQHASEVATAPPSAEYASVLFYRGQALRRATDFDGALAAYMEGKAMFLECGELTVEFCNLLTGIAITLSILKRPEEALLACEEGNTHYVARGAIHTEDYANHLKVWGRTLFDGGDVAGALQKYDLAKGIFERLGATGNVWYVGTLAERALALVRLGMADEAKCAVADATRIIGDIGGRGTPQHKRLLVVADEVSERVDGVAGDKDPTLG